MRIALVHYSSRPAIAGVELVIDQHARELRRHGHQVTVIADRAAPGEPTEAADSEGEAGLAVTELGTQSDVARRAQAALAREEGAAFAGIVAELVARLGPILAAYEVVVLHNVATMHFHPALTAALWELGHALARVRFICWVHDLAACNPDYAPQIALDHAPWNLLRAAHPRFTYVAVSEFRRQQFTELTGQPLARCRTIPNGVDLARTLDLSPRIAALAEQLRWFESELILLHPTRLLRRKNVELTIRVTAELSSRGIPVTALVTAPPELHSGAGSLYAQELRELIATLGVADRVIFLHALEPIEDSALAELYRLADALFFPSWQEGFGLPLLEAAVHRLPVFCSDIEPLRTLLPAGTTTFRPDASAREVANLITATLTALPQHRARAHTLKHLSWPAIYRNFLSPLLAEPEPT